MRVIQGVLNRPLAMTEMETTERVQKFVAVAKQRFQHYLDRSSPLIAYRWMSLGAAVLVYLLRVYFLEGFYIVTYGLGIFNLNLLLGFISPQVDPENEGLELPKTSTDEFKPFVRKLPEFKFWFDKLLAKGLFMNPV